MYGLIVRLRNRLFDREIKPSVRFDVPVICIGNLTVGGTGKTPHTEYLIKLLKDKYDVAVLSRGYRRKTKGYVEATDNSTASEIGDEPLQIHRKFPDITVAVQEKRVEGIRQILHDHSKTGVILLDDAYQHRHVKPSLSILLTDYNRPIWKDRMLPFGRLREPMEGKSRADIIIVTKCPKDISAAEQHDIIQHLQPTDRQQVYFTYLEYGQLSPNTGEDKTVSHSALTISGIASPEPFEEYVKSLYPQATALRFPDHHGFNCHDIAQIQRAFEPIRQTGGIIITTEKDCCRMLDNEGFKPLLPYIHYIPVQTAFINGNETFDSQIIKHIDIFQQPTVRVSQMRDSDQAAEAARRQAQGLGAEPL